MKSDGIKGVLQLVLSIVLYFLIDNYLFWLLGKIGIHFTGDLYNIASLVKYIVICLFIYLIYRYIKLQKFFIKTKLNLNIAIYTIIRIKIHKIIFQRIQNIFFFIC